VELVLPARHMSCVRIRTRGFPHLAAWHKLTQQLSRRRLRTSFSGGMKRASSGSFGWGANAHDGNHFRLMRAAAALASDDGAPPCAVGVSSPRPCELRLPCGPLQCVIGVSSRAAPSTAETLM